MPESFCVVGRSKHCNVNLNMFRLESRLRVKLLAGWRLKFISPPTPDAFSVFHRSFKQWNRIKTAWHGCEEELGRCKSFSFLSSRIIKFNVIFCRHPPRSSIHLIVPITNKKAEWRGKKTFAKLGKRWKTKSGKSLTSSNYYQVLKCCFFPSASHSPLSFVIMQESGFRESEVCRWMDPRAFGGRIRGWARRKQNFSAHQVLNDTSTPSRAHIVQPFSSSFNLPLSPSKSLPCRDELRTLNWHLNETVKLPSQPWASYAQLLPES